jgi:hypothetical protein
VSLIQSEDVPKPFSAKGCSKQRWSKERPYVDLLFKLVYNTFHDSVRWFFGDHAMRRWQSKLTILGFRTNSNEDLLHVVVHFAYSRNSLTTLGKIISNCPWDKRHHALAADIQSSLFIVYHYHFVPRLTTEAILIQGYAQQTCNILRGWLDIG